MSVRHHVGEDLLLQYASGALDEGWALAVATHLALCPSCRAAAAAYDALGGAVLNALAPAPPAEGAFERCIGRIEGETRPETTAADAPLTASDSALPAPLRAYVGGDLDAVRWRKLGGGLHQAPLPVGGPAKARLLRIEPGAQAPLHGHRGVELTVVISGAYEDAAGVYRRGDIEAADVGFDHAPVAASDTDCVCLFVADAPLRFHGFLPRLTQRFNGL